MFQWVDLTRFVVVKMGDAELKHDLCILRMAAMHSLHGDYLLTLGLRYGINRLIFFEPDLIRLG